METPCADINAGVIPSRFRAEMTAFLREKEMTIFFASMAHHFSEHASHAVSRGSVAALIPREKRAKLAQPLRQNAPKPARIFTGTDTERSYGLTSLSKSILSFSWTAKRALQNVLLLRLTTSLFIHKKKRLLALLFVMEKQNGRHPQRAAFFAVSVLFQGENSARLAIFHAYFHIL